MIIKTITAYGTAIFLVALAVCIKMMYPPIGHNTPFLLFFPVIVMVAWMFDRSAAIFTAVLAVGCVNYLFLGVSNEFDFNAHNLVCSAVFVLESCLIAVLIDHCRRTIRAKSAANNELTNKLEYSYSTCQIIPHMVWLADDKGLCVTMPHFLNRQWTAYTGLSQDVLTRVGWLRSKVIHPDDLAILTKHLAGWVAQGKPYTYEVRLRRHDGEYRYHMARVTPTTNSAGKVMWIGTMTDCHEEKMATAALALTDKRKDEFLAMLAHELRNPLAPIRNCLSVLRKFESVRPDMAHIIGMMDRQLRQMTRLVEDLMDVSRINQNKITLQKEPLDVESVIMQAVDAARPSVDFKKQHMKVDAPADKVWVDGDRTRLTQIISNLLTNASKYTEDDGCISVSLTTKGKNAVVTVVDDGTGIDPKVQPYIFDLFMQVEDNLARSQGGLGIGLSLVKKLTEQHGGKVSVHSEGLGRGSTFTLTLPLSETQKGRGQNDSAVHTVINPLRIVLADDNPDAAESLRLFLEGEGHEVRSAGDGQAALNLIVSYKPDVAILDIGMPRMNGYEVAAAIRDRANNFGCENTLLIAATGYGQPGDKEMALACGFDHHLTKPFASGNVLTILAQDQMSKKLGIATPRREAARRQTDESTAKIRKARLGVLS